jgi:predicted AAA+ superfamily ATPase
MKRSIEIDLHRWKNQEGRLPLLLRGARQVGKSYVIEAFAKEAFDHFVKVNLEEKPELKQFFEATLDPYVITDNLARYFGTPIHPGKTLLLIDEIQECPKAILALRYFKENYPALHVIAAGSLLEFALKDSEFQMPVGRIESLYLKPLSFQEYLQASPRSSLCAMLSEATLENPLDNISHQLLIDI